MLFLKVPFGSPLVQRSCHHSMPMAHTSQIPHRQPLKWVIQATPWVSSSQPSMLASPSSYCSWVRPPKLVKFQSPLCSRRLMIAVALQVLSVLSSSSVPFAPISSSSSSFSPSSSHSPAFQPPTGTWHWFTRTRPTWLL